MKKSKFSVKDICISVTDGWFEKLTYLAEKEFLNRKIYERNYSHKMTYDRFKYLQNLEYDIFFGYISQDRAIDLINKYDEHHLTERSDKF